MAILLHLTTVHPRHDTRIFIKEAQTLASRLPHRICMMVADGKGDVDAGPGGVSVLDLGALEGGRLRRAFLGSRRAYRAIRKLGPAIVHFHDPELIPLGMLLEAAGFKVVYDVHEDVPRQVHSKFYLPKVVRYPVSWMISAVEWCCTRVCTAVVPATPIYAWRFPAAKTVVVNNFPILSEIAVEDPVPYGIRPPGFAYVGGIERARGIFEMVRAFELLDGAAGATFELAGWFSPPALEGDLRALPGWSRVRFHGEVGRPQVARILARARAGLVTLPPEPTHIESYPIKMFEYMAAGLPVIASDFPVWRRIIDDAGCGLLVDPLDPASIAKAMRWVLDHPGEAEAMGRRGRLAVERGYTWDTEAAKLVGLYDRLLAPPHPAIFEEER